MKTRLKIGSAVFAAIVLVSVCFYSCQKDTTTSSAHATSPYRVYMTDAPANYQQVNVNITGVQVHSDITGWGSLAVNAGIYNLLTLTNGNDTLLATGVVPVGNISQIRLILGTTGNTVMINDTLYPLQTPSDQQSGLKLNVNTVVTAAGPYNLTIDFDAGKSVVATGAGTYILKPVIRANISPYTGEIKGVITPATTPSEVLAISGAMDTASTFSATVSGSFMIQGLATGSYTVVVIPQSPFTTSTFTGVSVTSGQVTDMGTITLH